jgi:hypothetical protein
MTSDDLTKAVEALLATVPPLGPNHHERDELSARNGRWGTCTCCPRDEQGRAFPERCVNTNRYDHNIPTPENELIPVPRKLLEALRNAIPQTDPTRATELEWLRWFACNADFGPADSDIQAGMKERFMRRTGKNLPLGWNYAEDGETTLDR